MIYLHVEKEGPYYSVKVDEYDVGLNGAPPNVGTSVKCIYSHNRYEILGDVIAYIEARNGGSLRSDNFERLVDLLDTAYVETLFQYHKRERSRKLEAQKKGWSLFSALS